MSKQRYSVKPGDVERTWPSAKIHLSKKETVRSKVTPRKAGSWVETEECAE